MKQILKGGAAALPLALCGVITLASPAGAQPTASDPLTDTIVVSARRSEPLEAETDPVTSNATAPDAAGLVAQLPGAALVNNGAISGQVQFRGLFSERLAVHVGGQDFQSGGPNAMDPPLHYAPVILLESISVTRGAAPVSDGPGLGASINATLKQVGYGTGSTLAPSLDVAASYRSADDGIALGGVAGMASETFRFNAIGSWEEGNDYRFPDGRVADTAYSRATFGVSAGMRKGGNELSLDLRRQETGASGNPPFAMDIEFFDTNFARLGFDGAIDGQPLKIEFGYTGVRHAMTNFAERPAPPDPARFRRTVAEADTFTAKAQTAFGPLAIGLDGAWIDRDVVITNPNNAAFTISAFDHIRQHRYGAFAELSGDIGRWHGDIGLRVDRHRAEMADPAVGAAVPPMVRMLAAMTAANNAPRSNTTFDAVARLWKETGTLRPRLTLSRKTRVPNAIERFGWLPIEASGGLADRNIYIGDQTIKPEVAWAAEAGLDMHADRLTIRPSVFYRRIDNYIQGTPVPATMTPVIMISAMNGDATPLRFGNVDAELYGFDTDFAFQLLPALRFDATVSYVRGKRRDAPDNLYRIAPLNGRASLTYAGDAWSVKGEVVAAAKQRKVAAYNEEPVSRGWVIANLWASLEPMAGLTVTAGVENLLDERYADHLSGINRVGGGDLEVGERMPGVGRSAFVRVGVRY
ncbi:MAG: TonB-dependent receptor [Sphingomonadaceae bacterium]